MPKWHIPSSIIEAFGTNTQFAIQLWVHKYAHNDWKSSVGLYSCCAGTQQHVPISWGKSQNFNWAKALD